MKIREYNPEKVIKKHNDHLHSQQNQLQILVQQQQQNLTFLLYFFM